MMRTFLLGVVMMLAVAFLDHETGAEIGFSIFYLFPVVFVTWRAGRRWGLVFAAACTVSWWANDAWFDGSPYSHPAIGFWNAGIRGVYFGVISVLLDRVKAAFEREKTVSKLKSDMLSFVSHEFGNHLTVLEMSVFLLREDPSFASKVCDTMARTLTLLKQSAANFLNSARMESGKFVLDIRRTELRQLVDESLKAMDPLVKEKGLEVARDFPRDIIPLEADPDALSLVMTNLIGNAVKYTPGGGRVTVRLVRPDPATPEAVVSVEDTGIGIPKAEQERIFSGFHRTKEGMAAAKGYGVGLKVATDILESHGSRIEVSSEPGKGSKFFFRLPVSKSPPAS